MKKNYKYRQFTYQILIIYLSFLNKSCKNFFLLTNQPDDEEETIDTPPKKDINKLLKYGAISQEYLNQVAEEEEEEQGEAKHDVENHLKFQDVLLQKKKITSELKLTNRVKKLYNELIELKNSDKDNVHDFHQSVIFSTEESQRAKKAEQSAKEAEQHADEAKKKTEEERQRAKEAEQNAEQERQKAKEAEQNAEQERQKAKEAEEERQRANESKQRAAEAEREAKQKLIETEQKLQKALQELESSSQTPAPEYKYGINIDPAKNIKKNTKSKLLGDLAKVVIKDDVIRNNVIPNLDDEKLFNLMSDIQAGNKAGLTPISVNKVKAFLAPLFNGESDKSKQKIIFEDFKDRTLKYCNSIPEKFENKITNNGFSIGTSREMVKSFVEKNLKMSFNLFFTGGDDASKIKSLASVMRESNLIRNRYTLVQELDAKYNSDMSDPTSKINTFLALTVVDKKYFDEMNDLIKEYTTYALSENKKLKICDVMWTQVDYAPEYYDASYIAREYLMKILLKQTHYLANSNASGNKELNLGLVKQLPLEIKYILGIRKDDVFTEEKSSHIQVLNNLWSNAKTHLFFSMLTNNRDVDDVIVAPGSNFKRSFYAKAQDDSPLNIWIEIYEKKNSLQFNALRNNPELEKDEVNNHSLMFKLREKIISLLKSNAIDTKLTTEITKIQADQEKAEISQLKNPTLIDIATIQNRISTQINSYNLISTLSSCAGPGRSVNDVFGTNCGAFSQFLTNTPLNEKLTDYNKKTSHNAMIEMLGELYNINNPAPTFGFIYNRPLFSGSAMTTPLVFNHYLVDRPNFQEKALEKDVTRTNPLENRCFGAVFCGSLFSVLFPNIEWDLSLFNNSIFPLIENKIMKKSDKVKNLFEFLRQAREKTDRFDNECRIKFLELLVDLDPKKKLGFYATFPEFKKFEIVHEKYLLPISNLILNSSNVPAELVKSPYSRDFHNFDYTLLYGSSHRSSNKEINARFATTIDKIKDLTKCFSYRFNISNLRTSMKNDFDQFEAAGNNTDNDMEAFLNQFQKDYEMKFSGIDAIIKFHRLAQEDLTGNVEFFVGSIKSLNLFKYFLPIKCKQSTIDMMGKITVFKEFVEKQIHNLELAWNGLSIDKLTDESENISALMRFLILMSPKFNDIILYSTGRIRSTNDADDIEFEKTYPIGNESEVVNCVRAVGNGIITNEFQFFQNIRQLKKIIYGPAPIDLNNLDFLLKELNKELNLIYNEYENNDLQDLIDLDVLSKNITLKPPGSNSDSKLIEALKYIPDAYLLDDTFCKNLYKMDVAKEVEAIENKILADDLTNLEDIGYAQDLDCLGLGGAIPIVI